MWLLNVLLCRGLRKKEGTIPLNDVHSIHDDLHPTDSPPRSNEPSGSREPDPFEPPTLVPDTPAADIAQNLSHGRPFSYVQPRDTENTIIGENNIPYGSSVSYCVIQGDSTIDGVSEVIGTKMNMSTIVNSRAAHCNLTSSFLVGEADVHQSTMTNSTISGTSIIKYCNLRNSHICCGAVVSQCKLVNTRICGGRHKISEYYDALVYNGDSVQAKVSHSALWEKKLEPGIVKDQRDEQAEDYFRDHTGSPGERPEED